MAGIFAFSPVNQASTVHDTVVADLQTSLSPSFDTILIQFRDLVFGDDADRFVLLEINRDVTEGYVVIRSIEDPECGELRVVVTDVPGTILASNTMASVPGNDASSGVNWDFLCQGDIPSDPDTVFVALARTPANLATIIADSIITTTIVSVD